jgi:hypothetical protein
VAADAVGEALDDLAGAVELGDHPALSIPEERAADVQPGSIEDAVDAATRATVLRIDVVADGHRRAEVRGVEGLDPQQEQALPRRPGWQRAR